MVAQLLESAVVGDDEPVKSPLLTQQVGQKPSVTGGWYALHGIESRHDRAGTGIDSRLIGLHILIEHVIAIGIDIIILTSRFHGSVESEMLDARHHRGSIGEVSALVAMYHRFGNTAAEIRIFTATLRDTSPTSVMTHINHRRERPAYTIRRSLSRRYLCRALNSLHIP